MFAIIGSAVVLASVIGGYLMEEGNLHVLIQPAELVIIFGAATGALVISSPPSVLSLIVKNLGRVISARTKTKAEYLEVLSLLNSIFTKMRKEGLIAIEADIENPETSPIFSKFPSILKNHHALNFICDNLKVIISTNISSYELDNVMELESDTHHREAMIPSQSVSKVADGLPGLGIVAAVLGVVLTMGKISEPPEVLGHSIGAALVGTFLGVLMCYGFVGPMGTNLEHTANEDATYYQTIKIALVSFVGGAAPQIAVEFARRVIPSKEKPTFSELEQELRK
jgi:chemotaxis protein MotA